MALDPHRLLAREFAPVEQAYTARDSILYALGIGLGADPLDAGQLRYLYEGAIVAAVNRRQRSGEGAELKLALSDVAFSMLSHLGVLP